MNDSVAMDQDRIKERYGFLKVIKMHWKDLAFIFIEPAC
jgi:hypothetical protein